MNAGCNPPHRTTPISPLSGPVSGSFNSLHRESEFLLALFTPACNEAPNPEEPNAFIEIVRPSGRTALSRKQLVLMTHFHAMRFLTLLFICFGLVSLQGVRAEDRSLKFPSPDGRFAVRLEKEGAPDEPGMTTLKLVDRKSGVDVVELDSLGHHLVDDAKVIWSPDSQRLALLSPDRRGGWTNLFVRKGAAFEKVDLPEMPPLKVVGHRADSKTVIAARVPLRWTGPRTLLIRHETEDDNGASAKMEVEIRFDERNKVTAVPAKK